MINRQVVIAGIVLLPIVGCIAQRQQEAVQAGISCLSAVYALPEAAPVRVHEPFNVDDATLAQLADNSFATEPESAAVSAIYPRVRACENEFLAQLEKLAPAFAPIYAKNYRDFDDDTVALIQGKMTWGDYTKRRRDRAIAGREAIAAENRRLTAENQARAAALIEGLAAVNAITQSQTGPQSLPTGAYRMPQEGITCTQMGMFTRCW
jgi:hypothetical protein